MNLAHVRNRNGGGIYNSVTLHPPLFCRPPVIRDGDRANPRQIYGVNMAGLE